MLKTILELVTELKKKNLVVKHNMETHGVNFSLKTVIFHSVYQVKWIIELKSIFSPSRLYMCVCKQCLAFHCTFRSSRASCLLVWSFRWKGTQTEERHQLNTFRLVDPSAWNLFRSTNSEKIDPITHFGEKEKKKKKVLEIEFFRFKLHLYFL